MEEGRKTIRQRKDKTKWSKKRRKEGGGGGKWEEE